MAHGTGPRFPPGVMRVRVGELHRAGMSAIEISRRLGVRKSTVAYHLRRLGVPNDPRFARRYEWAGILKAYLGGAEFSDLQAAHGFSRVAFYEAAKRADVKLRSSVIPIEELLVLGRPTRREHLKRRLLSAGLKQNRCEECGIERWRGRKLTMQLHHVNGNGSDNRLANLQFLCANCHSQTPTYGGRNKLRPVPGVGRHPRA